jgi:catechol 2,3-dioxygenase-like lactoylglutathione lyase family enzyme
MMQAPFSHVTLGSDDIARATAFYDAVLAPLGWARLKTRKTAVAYGPGGWSHVEPPFWVLRPANRQPARPGNGAQVSFHAPTRAAVDACHTAALAMGAPDEGGPGLRAHYHAHFYGAYMRDPDGNKLLAVCHEAPDAPRHLVTASRLPDPDRAYALLTQAHRGLNDHQAADFDARLLLILMNQIGDMDVLAEALDLAKQTGG